MNLDKSERLSLEAFGATLVETGDLDPIYVMLHRGMSDCPDQLRSWLLAYWCYYHAGFASYVSELSSVRFWEAMAQAARNETVSPVGGRWPRGRERRHFRGQKAIDAVTFLSQNYPYPQDAVHSLEFVSHDYRALMARIEMWPQFGPWIAFKIADMMERVLGSHVRFPESVIMYDSPTKAAVLWVNQLGDSIPPNPVGAAINFLRPKLYPYTAPPRDDRPLNVQEYETILCKWGAHMHGQYPVGIDSHELRHALSPWSAVSRTARMLMDFVPGPRV